MKKQLELIQAIRGIAAVLVVYLHTGHRPQFGAFGVDIFFVLSGCIMAMLMAQGPTAAAFLWRRLIRIAPLYFLVTTWAYIVSCLAPSVRAPGNIPSLLEYLQSIAFIPYQGSSGQTVPVLGVGWTLNYELYFYLCCAAACFLSLHHRSLWATLVVGVTGIVCFQVADFSVAARFYSNPIILEFVAGMAVWHVATGRLAEVGSGWTMASIPFLIVAMVWTESTGVSFFSTIDEWSRPACYLLPASLLVGCAILAEPFYRKASRPIRSALMILGDASYAIYLTHTFIIGFLKIAHDRLGLMHPPSLSWVAIALLASVLVGVAVSLWVEVPMRRFLSTLEFPGRRRLS